MIRALVNIPCVLIIALIIYLNGALYYNPDFAPVTEGGHNIDLYHQLKHLKKELHQGSGADMQNIYPEGFMFLTSLYGLAWYDLAGTLPMESGIRKEGLAELSWAVDQVHSDHARSIFDPDLHLPYGAFYTGWSNYLLGKKLALQDRRDRSKDDVDRYLENCKQILRIIEESPTPYPESYPGMSWPADMVVCVASLYAFNNNVTGIYREHTNTWIKKVKNTLDNHGLIPHATDYISGRALQNARGSSQSLMLGFLYEIDSHFAKQQLEKYKTLFLDKRFGLTGIREYPMGISGPGDIDSGPVILGVGGAASIVGQRTLATYGDDDTAVELRNAIETFGFPLTSDGEKKYLFGQLPMADTFIAWANAAEPNQANALQHEKNWRARFQVYSVVLAVLLAIMPAVLLRRWLKTRALPRH